MTDQTTDPQLPTSSSALLQSAMRSGVEVGMFFLLQAASFLLYRWGLLSSLLFLVGFVMVPVMLVVVTLRHKRRQNQRTMRYMEAVGYMMWSYLFALIIATLSFYISSHLLLHDPAFIELLEQSMEILSQVTQDDATTGAMREQLMGITPRSFTISSISSALFFGLIFIYLSAIFVRRDYGK